jgi:hypothetical protein
MALSRSPLSRSATARTRRTLATVSG